MLIGARTAAWSGGKALPYDAEVDYIASDGKSYINTGIVPVLSSTIECSFKVLRGRPDVVFSGISKNGIGITNWSSGGLACYFGNVGYIPSSGVIPIGVGTAYNLIIDSQYLRIDSQSIFLGATKMGSSNAMMLLRQTWTASSGITAISFFRHSDNNANITEMIPVRFTNENGVSEGAMYDRVSGKLFRNAGMGAFVIGPDKVA